ncbi:putative threonylcarbamoyl-AMP synthase [Rhizocola hellebori]|uniref:L-threonylcarbamoyladenylate synthase n=1 Tax=Rhizocola hellebori TaxID=1392758 RepID=A0A8J3QKJ0_9ACTN|nr:L-threonylcarbamoyladenylate synthase [Rhizocola hellebori]GIH11405.1 putative threonylcarbamoyl-AMP synthase [Rhizocola hellebori]
MTHWLAVRLFDCRNIEERDRGIKAAIDAVGSGDLVVLPTDTVYGIGADAFKAWSVTNLLNAKGRDRQMPPPVLVGSRHTLDGLVTRMPPAARDLVAAFWPGALTIVVEQAPSLQWDLGDTGGTVAVRMPLHPVALEVLRATGPMAVSSANLTGQPPAITAEQARDQLSYKVSVYLEAGECPSPVPSTIVDVTADRPRLLRAGAITVEQLREVVGEVDGADS